MFDCPKCGYPERGNFKGLYTPGSACDGCAFVETDPAILAKHAKHAKHAEARAVELEDMLSLIGRARGAVEGPPLETMSASSYEKAALEKRRLQEMMGLVGGSSGDEAAGAPPPPQVPEKKELRSLLADLSAAGVPPEVLDAHMAEVMKQLDGSDPETPEALERVLREMMGSEAPSPDELAKFLAGSSAGGRTTTT